MLKTRRVSRLHEGQIPLREVEAPLRRVDDVMIGREAYWGEIYGRMGHMLAQRFGAEIANLILGVFFVVIQCGTLRISRSPFVRIYLAALPAAYLHLYRLKSSCRPVYRQFSL